MCRPPGFVLCLSASAVKTFYVRRCRRAAPASPSPDVPGEIKAIILSRQPSHGGLRVKKKICFSVFLFRLPFGDAAHHLHATRPLRGRGFVIFKNGHGVPASESQRFEIHYRVFFELGYKRSRLIPGKAEQFVRIYRGNSKWAPASSGDRRGECTLRNIKSGRAEGQV